MRILLTGSTGFIGSALLPKLLAAGHEVHTIERYVTGRYSLDANAIAHYANLTDYSAIRHIVKQVQPDAVIHLAAISAVSFSYDHPIEVSEVNYLGSVNLAEACYKEVPDFQQFLHTSTSEIYGMTLTDKTENPESNIAILVACCSFVCPHLHICILNLPNPIRFLGICLLGIVRMSMLSRLQHHNHSDNC